MITAEDVKVIQEANRERFDAYAKDGITFGDLRIGYIVKLLEGLHDEDALNEIKHATETAISEMLDNSDAQIADIKEQQKQEELRARLLGGGQVPMNGNMN